MTHGNKRQGEKQQYLVNYRENINVNCGNIGGGGGEGEEPLNITNINLLVNALLVVCIH